MLLVFTCHMTAGQEGLSRALIIKPEVNEEVVRVMLNVILLAVDSYASDNIWSVPVMNLRRLAAW
jgi:hypothetical protein